jgi:diaminohydroxyphosphoribosylaminopyrimidine deaminase / 5-amino-6-(5-phosphoribosylamino)uracil reductase
MEMSTTPMDEDTAWSLVRAVRPGTSGKDAFTRIHHDPWPDVWLQVDASGAWGTSTEVSPEARDLLELYLPLQLQADLVVAQWGQSIDGRIATEGGRSHYITGPDDIRRLHRLRALVDAVIVGSRTVTLDDPRLTVRLVEGDNPLRVVLDPDGRLDERRQVFSDGAARTLVVRRTRTHLRQGYGGQAAGDRPTMTDGVLWMPVLETGGFDPRLLIDVLRQHGYRRVLVEGGGITVSRFLQAGVVDRLHVTVAPMLLGSGRAGLTLEPIESLDLALRPRCRYFRLGDDMLFDLDLRPRR